MRMEQIYDSTWEPTKAQCEAADKWWAENAKPIDLDGEEERVTPFTRVVPSHPNQGKR